MATTVQNVVDRAGERSNLNDVTLIPADELEAYVTSLERQIYLIAARENPDFFGKEATSAVRGSATATWDLDATPGNIAAISVVEVSAVVGIVSGITSGTVVNVVSYRDQFTALAPRIYIRSRIAKEYGSDLQTDSLNYVSRLKLWYSHLPSTRTAHADTLDIPDEFDNLIYLPLARIMALRDQRPEELEGIDAEYQLAMGIFMQHVSVYDEVTIRPLDQISAAAVGFTGGG